MMPSDTALDPTSDELEAALGAIATPAEIAMIRHYLVMENANAQSDARAKASERTQRYKLRKALRLEPSSQHILQACAYVVFSRDKKDTLPFVEETLDLLVLAGFERKHAAKAMKRFMAGASERKTNWAARTKRVLSLAISNAIEELRKRENVTK